MVPVHLYIFFPPRIISSNSKRQFHRKLLARKIQNDKWFILISEFILTLSLWQRSLSVFPGLDLEVNDDVLRL